jgi:hypothetical protein
MENRHQQMVCFKTDGERKLLAAPTPKCAAPNWQYISRDQQLAPPQHAD